MGEGVLEAKSLVVEFGESKRHNDTAEEQSIRELHVARII
jgi:hypothetical protein